jgi:hypothetical protein
LIRGYGVDIAALDGELAGDAPAPEHAQQSAVQALLKKELAPLHALLAHQQQQEQFRAQQESAQIDQTIEEFAVDPKNTHFDAVADTMADLLEVAERRGGKMTLQQAYDSACWQTPEIRSILIRESQAQAAGAGTQAAQRAKAAAVSVRSGPRATLQTEAGSANRSRMDDIAEAFDKVSNAQ